MDSLSSPVLLLSVLALSLSSPALADRKFGCLFEDELCSPYEFCVNDEVFGRCQELAAADLYTYDISSSALQRLRILLQKLAHRGLTWQDDLTQQVISRELSKLRTVPLRHQTSAQSPLNAFSGSRDLKLSRTMKQYLSGLGFLPEGQTGSQRANVQNEDVKSDGDLEPSRSKPKHSWKETSVFSHQKEAGRPPITNVFTHTGEGKHPKLSPSYANRDPGRNALLASHLERLLSEVPSTRQGNEKLHYINYIRPASSNRAASQVAFTSKSQRPNPDRLLFKASSNPPAAKEPLGAVDERFIQNVVNQFGRHSVHFESLMGTDLEHLAGVIAGALNQEKEGRPGPETGSEPAESRPVVAPLKESQDRKQEHLKKEDPARPKEPGQQRAGADKEPVDKHAAFFSKLLDYLNMEPFNDAPQVNVGAPASLRKTVGQENVQSRTTLGQLPAALHLPEKPQQQQQQQQPHEEEPQKMKVKTQLVHVAVKEFSSRGKDRHFGYIITGSDSLTSSQGSELMARLTEKLHLHASDLTQLSVLGPALTFRIGPNPKNVTTADLVQEAVQQKQQLEKETGLKIVEAGVSDRGSLTEIPVVKTTRVESGQFLFLSVLCMIFILVALLVSTTFFCLRQRSHLRLKEKLSSLGTDTSTDAPATYQELCRQRMAIRTSERVERPETLRNSRLNSVSSQFSDGPAASPSTRSSTSSWCEEPVPSNMDISTGHMILSYMEDHLKNKNRLEREWEALCSYQAEPGAWSVGHGEQNSRKNRSDAVVVYDHSRTTLKPENNLGNSDYINASPIMDHDPRNPTYISSQGPLLSTVADFWQMVWESGCVVVVMLTPLSENGVKQCHPYWPDEGSDVYHVYEVNLVSEHIWCEDFLVRSFYLKNLQTNETRTVTQFHFLSWMDRGIPNSARTLLDFRRKVNKCYRGRSCPIIVHCSDGAGRSGTYILIDMVLNRMAKGAKEIDIAATLEHLRDQRAGMVQTKEQFEFGLTAVAEEVNAILKALP